MFIKVASLHVLCRPEPPPHVFRRWSLESPPRRRRDTRDDPDDTQEFIFQGYIERVEEPFRGACVVCVVLSCSFRNEPPGGAEPGFGVKPGWPSAECVLCLGRR